MLNLLAQGLSHRLNKSDKILLSVAEHHTNLVPWQLVAKERGAKLVFISGSFDNVGSQLTSKTKIIFCTAASNVFGQINDVDIFKSIRDKYPNIFWSLMHPKPLERSLLVSKIISVTFWFIPHINFMARLVLASCMEEEIDFLICE